MLTTRYILDESHLSHYDERLKSWVSSQPVKTLPSSLYPWTLSDKAGAVGIWPVGGTELKPAVDFLFTEVPPASGDKGPSNPSTISGVSSVKVTRCGKNLFERIGDGSVTSNGLTLVRNADGTCLLSGTATANTFFYINSLNLIQTKAGLTYTLSGCPSGGSASTYRLACAATKDGTAYYYVDYGSGSSSSKSFDAKWQMYIYVVSGTVISTPVVFKPQFELGSTATSFEPYEGTDYTVNLGNTFYGGEIDLATGVMTVTHYCWVWNNMNFGNPESYNSETGYAHFNYYSRPEIAAKDFPNNANVDGYYSCSHFPTKSTSSYLAVSNGTVNYPNIWFIPDGTQLRVTAPFQTKEAFNTWINEQYTAGTPVTLVYKLATPETVQLSPLTISALAQPDKYTPRLNTVYTDAPAVQVGYVKSPIREEFELQQAIISQGGNI